MKLHKNCKIELCVSSDKTRKHLNHAILKGDKLIATDGRKIVAITVEISEGDTDGFVTAQALQMARKLKGGEYPIIEIHAKEKLETIDGATLVRPSESPNHPTDEKAMEYISSNPDATHPIKIAFNVKYLMQMARAMGVECVTMNIKSGHDPIIVTPIRMESINKLTGILMPMHITD